MEGSSPLTRGKRLVATLPKMDPRLIPAHAGKTSSGSASSSPHRAHPRSRGENKDALASVKGTAGSSPLTRGKLGDIKPDYRDVGLIPAHAGKTSVSPLIFWSPWAHPRSRGENSSRTSALVPLLGSSPLTRGKPVPCDRGEAGDGLIPAHAGKTWP